MQDMESLFAAADAVMGVAPAETPETPAPAPAEVAAPAAPETPIEAPPVIAEPSDKLAALAKQEQESRAEKFRAERLAFAKEKEELAALRAEAAKLSDKSSIKEKLLRDPVAFAKDMGLDPNDFAKRLWQKQIKGEDNKAEEKVSGVEAELLAVRRELQELKETATQKEQAATQRQQAEEYKASLATTLAEHIEALPHMKPFFEARKEDVLGDIYGLAIEMHKADPETPVTPSALFAEAEKRFAKLAPQRVKQLEAELNLWRAAGTKPAPVNTGNKNASPPVPPTLSNSLAGATERKSVPQTEEERLADAIAFMKSMRSGGST